MPLIPLITIPLIYLLAALFKPYLQKYLPFNLCAICLAVSLSWLILLILWLEGEAVNLLEMGILMGMSIIGIMYKLEAVFAKHKLKNFWFVRLIIVLGGFYFVTFLLLENWQTSLLIFLTGFLLIIMAAFLFQKEGRKKSYDSIKKRLDDCC